MIHVIATIEVLPGARERLLAAPHMQSYRERVRDLIVASELRVTEPA